MPADDDVDATPLTSSAWVRISNKTLPYCVVVHNDREAVMSGSGKPVRSSNTGVNR